MTAAQIALAKNFPIFVGWLQNRLAEINECDANILVSEGFGPDTSINTAIERAKEMVNNKEHIEVALNVYLRWYRDCVILKPVEVSNCFVPASSLIGKIAPYEMIGVDHMTDKATTRVFLRFNEAGNAVCLMLSETEKMLAGQPFDRTQTTTWERIRKLE